MAEALLRKRLADKNQNIQVASAGVGALVGHDADATAKELMNEIGIDISNHCARHLNAELLSEYDLVLVMERGHIKAVHTIAPLSRGRVHLLGKWSDFEIPDPYKQPRHEFEVVLELIEHGVNEWIERL